MNRTLIYIGDDLLDLDISTVIAITIQSINAGDLKLRNVSYTNQFMVRDSETNCRILGYVNNEWSASAKPYQYNNCKVVQDGIETLRGLLLIRKFENGYFYINIYEDLFDIFAYLKGKKIKDINPIADSAWNASYMDSVRNSTSGIMAAIVQWKTGSFDIFDPEFFLPSFYYHTFIREILGDTGLTLSGDILTDSWFTDLVIPFPGDSFTPGGDEVEADAPIFIGSGSVGYGTGASITVDYPTGLVANDMLLLFIMDAEPGSSINGITGWTVMDSGNFNDSTPVAVGSAAVLWRKSDGSESGSVTSTRSGVGAYSLSGKMVQYRGTANILIESSAVKANGNGATTITWDLTTVAGVKRTLVAAVGMLSSTLPSTPSGYTSSVFDTVDTGALQFAIAYNTKEDVIVGSSVTAPGGNSNGWISFHISLYNNETTPTIDWNQFWPDIEVTDILKDFFVRFGIIAKQKDGTLYLKTLEAIIADRPNAVDWSAKLVSGSKEIDFSNKYAQQNYFDYNNQLNDPDLGRGIMTISNETLKPLNTIFTSIFESVELSLTAGNHRTAHMNVYDSESVDATDFNESPSLTLLTLRNPSVGDPNITFFQTSRADYKLAYFVDPLISKDSSFQYFVDEFYLQFEAALQKSKVIEKEYLLTELDIAGYDSHKIIYDGEGYYIINKIKNFVSGRITKVELFKVG